jgi:phosphotriesterase-related protein
MFLSQDYCSTLDWFPIEVQEALKASEVPEWSMTMLFESVIPYLKENGLTDEQLETMLVDNPRRWFTA